MGGVREGEKETGCDTGFAFPFLASLEGSEGFERLDVLNESAATGRPQEKWVINTSLCAQD